MSFVVKKCIKLLLLLLAAYCNSCNRVQVLVYAFQTTTFTTIKFNTNSNNRSSLSKSSSSSTSSSSSSSTISTTTTINNNKQQPILSTRIQKSSSSSTTTTSLFASSSNIFDRIGSVISQSINVKRADPTSIRSDRDRRKVQIITLLRVGIPSIISSVVAYILFPFLSLSLATTFGNFGNPDGVFAVLSQDSSQFVQNFLTVAGLLFSILVGQTYYFLYTQQESVYYALFLEVTEAKSLLEQVALVCQGRSMYYKCLQSISNYVQNDLKQIQKNPAILLSARPVDDPLESIMYMTSVGVPSTVYETVKSLREARARRLGALQRKLPSIHMLLLWILAGIELISFPLLGAGTQVIGGYNLLTIEGVLFGVMTGGIVLTLRVVGELWRPAGGAYNVDSVLSTMVSGLEEELNARMTGQRTVRNTFQPSGARDKSSSLSLSSSSTISSSNTLSTITNNNNNDNEADSNSSSLSKTSSTIQTQGADIGIAIIVRTYNWIIRHLFFFGKRRR